MKKLKFFKVIGASLLLLVLSSRCAFIIGQEENLNVLESWTGWADGKNMLVRHLNDQAFTCLDERDSIIASIRTKDDWIKRQNVVRDHLMEIVGPFPEKTPLNARITGTVRKEGYRVEKIIYESMPGFYVTGCLFIPEGVKGRRPAILNLIGHTDISFRGEIYQTLILHLVKKGFIVFAIDPIGQGERFQYFDVEKKAPVFGPGTAEHTYFGNQCFLSGVSPARYFIWDGIRGIDYLVSRKEVDQERIGVTGLSGGGTLTAYISAFDERVKASAPSCYITGFRRLLESIGAQDAEQNLYHEIKAGITHADFIEVRAPRPTLIVSTTRDFFSIQGARESYSEALKAYKAFGRSEDLMMTEDDYEHGFTSKNNEATCAFFQKYLSLPGDPSAGEIKTLNPEELKITSTGQVSTTLNSETVFNINARESGELLARIDIARMNTVNHLDEVQKYARALSGYTESGKKTTSVFRGAYQRDGYSVEMYAVLGDGNYVIPVLLFIPKGTGKHKAVIYLNPLGKIADADKGGPIEQLTRKGYLVIAPDLLGIGEVAPEKTFYNASYLISVLTGKTLTGNGSEDINSIVNFLTEREDVDISRIGALAYNELCPVLLHAAVFNKSISSMVLIGSPVSFRSIVMNRFYDRNLAAYTVPGALTRYDLPDLIGCIAPRKIILAGLKDQMSQPAGKELIDNDLKFPLNVYLQGGIPENMQIRPEIEDIGSMVNWCLDN